MGVPFWIFLGKWLEKGAPIIEFHFLPRVPETHCTPLDILEIRKMKILHAQGNSYAAFRPAHRIDGDVLNSIFLINWQPCHFAHSGKSWTVEFYSIRELCSSQYW